MKYPENGFERRWVFSRWWNVDNDSVDVTSKSRSFYVRTAAQQQLRWHLLEGTFDLVRARRELLQSVVTFLLNIRWKFRTKLSRRFEDVEVIAEGSFCCRTLYGVVSL